MTETQSHGGMQEQLRQKKEYDIVIGERDILGTQLIRRNDELALLYEKIKIQQSTLNKGQLQYRDRSHFCRKLCTFPLHHTPQQTSVPVSVSQHCGNKQELL